jgi:hypothetical protein
MDLFDHFPHIMQNFIVFTVGGAATDPECLKYGDQTSSYQQDQERIRFFIKHKLYYFGHEYKNNE